MYADADMKNLHLDLMYKYKGFAFYQEYCSRISNNGITVDPKDKSKIRSIYSGYGSLTQMSYLFKNNVELAVRYANITPDKKLYLNEIFTSINEKKIEQYHLGISKYIYGHRVKVQGNLLYHITHDLKNLNSTKQIGAIFQIELGI